MWLQGSENLFVNLDDIHVVKVDAQRRSAELIATRGGQFDVLATVTYPPSYNALLKQVAKPGWFNLGDGTHVDLNKCSKIEFATVGAKLRCELYFKERREFEITDERVAADLQGYLTSPFAR